MDVFHAFYPPGDGDGRVGFGLAMHLPTEKHDGVLGRHVDLAPVNNRIVQQRGQTRTVMLASSVAGAILGVTPPQATTKRLKAIAT